MEIKNKDDLLEHYKRREKAYRRALEKAGLFLRQHPPCDTCEMVKPEIISIVVNGENRDPNGREWTTYFLGSAIEEILNEEGENNNGR